MRTGIAIILITMLWLLIAPWIAKGYGQWHWPNPFSGRRGAWVEAAFFYLPPGIVIALITGKFNAPNQ